MEDNMMNDNMMKTVVGLFDERSRADAAVEELSTLGIRPDAIDFVSSDENQSRINSGHWGPEELTMGERIKRFFNNLFDLNDDESDIYAESVRRGGVLITVRAEETQTDQVAEILNRYGAVDVDERSRYYRSSGYDRYETSAPQYSADESMKDRESYSQWRDTQGLKTREEVIPVIEESVHIGKRDVSSGGGVRVYSHVTETPIEEEVTLRTSHIDVERNKVNRPVDARDMEAFRDGELEFRETKEEVSIDKEARVVEEVRVKQQVDETTESVHETARRRDVIVEKLDDKRAGDRNRDADLRH